MSKSGDKTDKKEIKSFQDYETATAEGAKLFNAGDYQKALGYFLGMAEYNPDNYKVYETLATIYLKLGDFDEATLQLERAYALLGKEKGQDSVVKMRSFDEALSSLEKIETLEKEYQGTAKNSQDDLASSSVRLPIQMSMHYMASGDYKKAEELLTRHLESYRSRMEHKD